MLLAIICGPAYAETIGYKYTKCEASVDNKVVIKGPCWVHSDTDIGSIQIFSTPNPRPGHYGTFFFVNTGDTNVIAYWNEGEFSHAHTELGDVVSQAFEDGTCWFNQRVKICYF